tara:strand:+ start:72 stop:524 length:453 start_codon:yes stop_codon:yes gene_type:complete
MACLNYCVLGAAFLGSSILAMMASKQSGNFVNFRKLLNQRQLEIYNGITRERMSIYIQGLILGVLLAVLITFNSSLRGTNKLCVFVVIALGTNYLFYSLHPKSTYMLLHLTSQQQNEAWLNIYKEMKLRCKLGLLLGLVGYILLGNGLCK